jgi:hypothetical protein
MIISGLALEMVRERVKLNDMGKVGKLTEKNEMILIILYTNRI